MWIWQGIGREMKGNQSRRRACQKEALALHAHCARVGRIMMEVYVCVCLCVCVCVFLCVCVCVFVLVCLRVSVRVGASV